MAHAKGQKEGQKAVQKASEKDHKHTKDKKAAQAPGARGRHIGCIGRTPAFGYASS